MSATITIQAQRDFGTDISVVVDDECNHAGAVVEMLEYSKPSFWADAGIYVNDDSEELPTLVCKCGLEEIQEPEEPDYYED